jgi:hypothetical protein
MALNYASRFLICPFVVWLGQSFGFVRFTTGWQILMVGFILAGFSVAADSMILPAVGNAMATLMDWGAATLILWLSGWVFPGAVVPFLGALYTGALLAASEWVMHRWLGAAREDRRRAR